MRRVVRVEVKKKCRFVIPSEEYEIQNFQGSAQVTTPEEANSFALLNKEKMCVCGILPREHLDADRNGFASPLRGMQTEIWIFSGTRNLHRAAFVRWHPVHIWTLIEMASPIRYGGMQTEIWISGGTRNLYRPAFVGYRPERIWTLIEMALPIRYGGMQTEIWICSGTRNLYRAAFAG